MQYRWTKEFDTKLTELYSDPSRPIVATIVRPMNESCGTHFTLNAIEGRIKRLGLCNRLGPTNLWDDERENYLVGIVDDDDQISAAEIAQAVNAKFGLQLTRNAICGKLNRMRRAGVISSRPRSQKKKVPRAPRVNKPRQRYCNGSRRVVTVFEAVDALELRIVPLEAARPRILITDLADNECRWPVASEDSLHFFCGHDRGFRVGADGTKKLLPYCGHHAIAARGGGTGAERAASRVSAAA
jgi:hypothetical protein